MQIDRRMIIKTTYDEARLLKHLDRKLTQIKNRKPV